MAKNFKQVTLRDIANAMGLSINTISCALKGRNSIAPETVKKIKEKAKELGYIPNNIAASMRTGFTKTIAIIVGDIVNPYFTILIDELERLIRNEGYIAIILVTEEDAELENQAVETAISRNVDGVILFPTCMTMCGIEMMRKVGVPFVLMARYFNDCHMNYVVCDDMAGGYIATKYLIDKGYKNIIHFAGPDIISGAYNRKLGYIKAMSEAGFKNITRNIIPCKAIVNKEMDRVISKTLQNRKAIEAIFTYSDIIAFRVIRIVRQLGLRLPAIVGFDNVQSKIDYGYDIPSINVNKALMAEKAVSQLFGCIRSQKKADEYLNEVVPVDLCER
jgi:LacI family transcriptional regulator